VSNLPPGARTHQKEFGFIQKGKTKIGATGHTMEIQAKRSIGAET